MALMNYIVFRHIYSVFIYFFSINYNCNLSFCILCFFLLSTSMYAFLYAIRTVQLFIYFWNSFYTIYFMNYVCVVYRIYILFYFNYMILKYVKSHKINNIPRYRFSVISVLALNLFVLCVL